MHFRLYRRVWTDKYRLFLKKKKQQPENNNTNKDNKKYRESNGTFKEHGHSERRA